MECPRCYHSPARSNQPNKWYCERCTARWETETMAGAFKGFCLVFLVHAGLALVLGLLTWIR